MEFIHQSRVTQVQNTHGSRNILTRARVSSRLSKGIGGDASRRQCKLLPTSMAHKEGSPSQDWRVKEMIDLCQVYFQDLWCEGKVNVADDILDPGFVHHDPIWRQSQLIVGPNAFKRVVTAFRNGYPDLSLKAIDFSSSKDTRVYVQWEGSATNLGKFKGREPSRHFSSISGVTTFDFTHDRSKISEAIVYRSPTREEKEALQGEADPLNLHLARLHFG